MKKIVEAQMKKVVSEKNFYDGRVVAINNYFSRNHFNLDLLENKALYLIFSHTSVYDFENNRVFVNKSSFIDKLGINKDGYKYTILKMILKKLYSKVVFDFEETNEIMGAFEKISLGLNKSRYFIVTLNKFLSSTLKKIKGNFTKLLISTILKFKSNNSINFYKLLCSWNHKQKKIWTVEEIKMYLNLEKKSYLNKKGYLRRSDFENKLLEKLKESINKFSELNLEYKRKGNDYEFTWWTDFEYKIEPKSYEIPLISDDLSNNSLKKYYLQEEAEKSNSLVKTMSIGNENQEIVTEKISIKSTTLSNFIAEKPKKSAGIEALVPISTHEDIAYLLNEVEFLRARKIKRELERQKEEEKMQLMLEEDIKLEDLVWE